MDRSEIKKMAKSLQAYSRTRSLLKMTKEELADMPKEVMIACAPNEIPLVWEKLPEHIRNDIDILKFQYCTERYDNQSSPALLRRVICCFCNLKEVDVVSKNSIYTDKSTSRDNTKESNIFCCCQ